MQHSCKVPYPAKSADGGAVVMVTPSKPTNHYFHLLMSCVLASEHHADFTGDVVLKRTVPDDIVVKENHEGLKFVK